MIALLLLGLVAAAEDLPVAAPIPAAIPLPASPALDAAPAPESAPLPDAPATDQVPAPLPSGLPAAPFARFRVRPWVGVTSLTPGGLESFPATYEDALLRRYGNPSAVRTRKKIRAALVQGIDAAYQVDRVVAVSLRVAGLVSDRGSSKLEASVPGAVLRSEWSARTDVVMVLAGGTASLPVTERTSLNVSLFLGTGWARVVLDEVVERVRPNGSVSLDGAASAEAAGTMFIPEFGVELARELTPSLTAGLALGIRFGGVDAFGHVHAAALDTAGTTAMPAGSVVLDATGRHDLAVNYRGPFLAASFTGKF